MLGRREAFGRGQPVVAHHRDQHPQRGPGRRVAARARRLRDLPRRPLEQQRPLGQHQFHVLAGGNLDRRVVVPARDRVGPRLHVELPQALAGHGHVRAVAVRAGRQFGHQRDRVRDAPRVAQHHPGADDAVPLAEHRGADPEGLPGDRLRRATALVHRRLHIEDRDSSHHPSYATERGAHHARVGAGFRRRRSHRSRIGGPGGAPPVVRHNWDRWSGRAPPLVRHN